MNTEVLYTKVDSLKNNTYNDTYYIVYFFMMSRVNAGGTIFETSRETLMKQPNSYLAQVYIFLRINLAAQNLLIFNLNYIFT